jgi:hypothetical protein
MFGHQVTDKRHKICKNTKIWTEIFVNAKTTDIQSQHYIYFHVETSTGTDTIPDLAENCTILAKTVGKKSFIR